MASATSTQSSATPSITYVDVLVIGAGISGISAGYHLQKYSPKRTYAILEGREAIGGTWDLFRYPGVRSDSDMYTLGYSFEPWLGEKTIADGSSIRRYVEDTARKYGIDQQIRFGHQVKRVEWSSEDSTWTVGVEGPDGKCIQYRCNFILACNGYFDYEAGYTRDFPGRDRFQGDILHPQFWPEDYDYAGKRAIVIGSGATAITLVPAMADRAAHVTMLQRSPSYVMSIPEVDQFADRLKEKLPRKLAHSLIRWKSISLGTLFLKYSLAKPDRIKEMVRSRLRQQLGSEFDIGKHFNPSYDPWQQRFCFTPQGDLFRSIREGQVSVVTDQIDRFTETGLRLVSGEQLDADLIVTATGLNVRPGNYEYVVDGKAIDLGNTVFYKGLMFSDVPNLAQCFGYMKAGSYTMRVDLTCRYVCRMLNYMDRKGYRKCVPQIDDPNLERIDGVSMTSGYLERAKDLTPKQSRKAPWKRCENYLVDLVDLRYRSVRDKALRFSA